MHLFRRGTLQTAAVCGAVAALLLFPRGVFLLAVGVALGYWSSKMLR